MILLRPRKTFCYYCGRLSSIKARQTANVFAARHFRLSRLLNESVLANPIGRQYHMPPPLRTPPTSVTPSTSQANNCIDLSPMLPPLARQAKAE